MINRILLILSLVCCFSCITNAQDSLNIATTTDSLNMDSVQVVEEKPVIPNAELEDYNVIMRTRDEGSVLVFTSTDQSINGLDTLLINGEEAPLAFSNGQAEHLFDTDAKGQLIMIAKKKQYKSYSDYQMYHVSKKSAKQYRVLGIPLWLSILPPLIAIILALIFREVVVSLFAGVVSGAFIVGGMRVDSLYWFVVSIFEALTTFVINALTDGGHMSVILFSLLIGGMVALISRNGGMQGVVLSLSKYARSPRSTQFITWFLGVAIFFDDYANTLIVGNTMRSVTDKFKISREKLAYIVDSTAAPVSAVAFITTWIGAELGYIESGIAQLQNFDFNMSAYAIFLASLKYSFYPILTLAFILIIIYTGKDYGPMLKAERRARTTGRVSGSSKKASHSEEDMDELKPVEGAPLKWYNAFIPVAVVILMTIYGLTDTGMNSSYGALSDAGVELNSMGWNETWSNLGVLSLSNAQQEIYAATSKDGLSEKALSIMGSESLATAKNLVSAEVNQISMGRKLGTLIGNSDSYIALLWASLSGVLAALFLTLFGKIMNLEESIGTMVSGFKTMLPALIILALAWALADLTGEIHTKDFLTSALSGKLNPYLLPVIVFVLAAFIAFSTGSSWSTMAILYPIVIPATWEISMQFGIDPNTALELLLNVIAIVLAASVVGDHCSPISDTTILSSLASECNHIDHVRTQLPYALTVGSISLLCGGISTLLGGGWLISIGLVIISLVILWLIVSKLGKRAEA